MRQPRMRSHAVWAVKVAIVAGGVVGCTGSSCRGQSAWVTGACVHRDRKVQDGTPIMATGSEVSC